MQAKSVVTPIPLLLLFSLAVADDKLPAPDLGEEVILKDSDFQEITANAIAMYPEITASPGIKLSGANHQRGEDSAWVIFHPHSANSGIKEAYSVSCARSSSAESWLCEAPVIRRYYQLQGQAAELRVTADIVGSAEAIAIAEAARASVPLMEKYAEFTNCEAITIMEANGGFIVGFSCEGMRRDTGLFVSAIPGADTTEPNGWQVSDYIPRRTRWPAENQDP